MTRGSRDSLSPARTAAPLFVLCFAVAVAACQQRANGSSAPVVQSQRQPATPAAKVFLNLDPAGTTDDTSKLVEQLASLFAERKKNFAYGPGTSGVGATVYVEAEDTLKLSEFFKVVGALKRSGADPVLIPTRFSQGRGLPNPLTLLVTVGNLKVDTSKPPAGGIAVGVANVPAQPDNAQPSADDLTDIVMSHDGEYLFGGRTLKRADLSAALKALPRKADGGEAVGVRVENEGQISYGSLDALAQAAYASGAKKLLLLSPSGN